MKKKELDLIKLTVTEDGDVFTRIYRPLRDDLSNWQLNKILGRMDKVAEVIAELITELGECKDE